MKSVITDLKTPFKDVYKALDLKDQRKAMRGAMRREANRLRKTAATNLRATGIGNGTRLNLAKGIYARVYPERYGLGFMVSVKPHGKKRGIHTNRQGMMKPVLLWAEDGTRYRRVGRRTKSFFGKSRFSGKSVRYYNRSGHSTGRMRRYAFLAKTEAQAAMSIEQNLFGDFRGNLEKAAQKKGLL